MYGKSFETFFKRPLFNFIPKETNLCEKLFQIRNFKRQSSTIYTKDNKLQYAGEKTVTLRFKFFIKIQIVITAKKNIQIKH